MKDERKERRMKERKRKAARKDENGTRLRLLQTTVLRNVLVHVFCASNLILKY